MKPAPFPQPWGPNARLWLAIPAWAKAIGWIWLFLILIGS